MDSLVKAKELVDQYYYLKAKKDKCQNPLYDMTYSAAKESALIHVNETLDLLMNLKATVEILKMYRFYFEVRIKIEKM